MLSQTETVSIDMVWTEFATVVTILAFGGGVAGFLFDILRTELKELRTDLRELKGRINSLERNNVVSAQRKVAKNFCKTFDDDDQ
jgi:hypothetical protein